MTVTESAVPQTPASVGPQEVPVTRSLGEGEEPKKRLEGKVTATIRFGDNAPYKIRSSDLSALTSGGVVRLDLVSDQTPVAVTVNDVMGWLNQKFASSFPTLETFPSGPVAGLLNIKVTVKTLSVATDGTFVLDVIISSADSEGWKIFDGLTLTEIEVDVSRS